MPELQRQRRQVAVKVRIKDIVYGRYVKEEGWTPNFVETEEGLKVSRANIMGAVVFRSDEENFNYKNLIVDDGSGKISVRSFEKNDSLNNFDIGDIILVIGRPREFNDEKYLIPEIVKKIQDVKWIQVRNLELDKLNKNIKKSDLKNSEHIEVETIKNDINENSQNKVVREEIREDAPDPNVIYDLIKKLDTGGGVLIDDIIKKSDSENVEKKINDLLENGDIFEVKPGIVKVLE
jgi:RPA family protein